jgi:hypothetical protein
MKVRKNVNFYNVQNGFSTFVGKGIEIVLGNGNTYAIIDGVKYAIYYDGYNNQILELL